VISPLAIPPLRDLQPGEDSPAPLHEFLQQHGRNADSFQAGLSYHRRLYFPDWGLVAFRRVGGVTVVAGEPIAAPGRLVTLLAALQTEQPGPVALVSASAPVRDELAAAGWGWLKVGEEPYWDPARWSIDGRPAAKVRHAVGAARRRELRVTETTPMGPEWEADFAAMHEVAAAWSVSHAVHQLGFMLTLAPFEDFRQRRYFVAREPAGRMVAFLAAVPIWARGGWYFQDFVRLPDAPNGVSELLFHEAMLALRRSGASLVTLGAAPLAGLEKEVPQRPWLNRLLGFAYDHLDSFYPFQSLSEYKAKYAPHWWEPKYLVFRPRGSGARVFGAVLRAYNGGSVTRLVASRVVQTLREQLRRDPETGRWPAIEHVRRLPGRLVEHDLLVGAALAIGIGAAFGDVAEHFRMLRSLDDVRVGALASLFATSLTVALLKARNRGEAHS